MVVLPGPTPTATPELLMTATLIRLELQLTVLLTFVPVVDGEENVPIAVKGCSLPCAMVALAGVSVIALRPTFNPVLPLTPFMLAVMTVLPTAPAVANPPGEVMLATPVCEELQAAVAVRFTMLLSLLTPVAVNCWVPPLRFGLGGVT